MIPTHYFQAGLNICESNTVKLWQPIPIYGPKTSENLRKPPMMIYGVLWCYKHQCPSQVFLPSFPLANGRKTRSLENYPTIRRETHQQPGTALQGFPKQIRLRVGECMWIVTPPVMVGLSATVTSLGSWVGRSQGKPLGFWHVFLGMAPSPSRKCGAQRPLPPKSYKWRNST